VHCSGHGRVRDQTHRAVLPKLLKRWILYTHHGAVQPEHLEANLDEFVFRFNRRTSSSRGMLFYRLLLQQAVITNPVTYSDIVVPERARRR
jgi:hypothetical protein